MILSIYASAVGVNLPPREIAFCLTLLYIQMCAHILKITTPPVSEASIVNGRIQSTTTSLTLLC